MKFLHAALFACSATTAFAAAIAQTAAPPAAPPAAAPPALDISITQVEAAPEPVDDGGLLGSLNIFSKFKVVCPPEKDVVPFAPGQPEVQCSTNMECDHNGELEFDGILGRFKDEKVQACSASCKCVK
ncbi:hypothetical protein BU24DRAFT_468193 [Aaosphaeria arxii CBS 175.79]|uniref:Uncharacterized protein n=1 Tax=Aaosphaeria arxii CBS 175.79 TaxID=1450172 RepID=A0A6A5X8C8_9PLEO|nr:uncharacterized protein BU24DRAFT_468193 [Aaosphaeria arxii CBS 175.79]KAF2009208.1 hypothetical protein BU24DRAFT_468193 [Aaosphaeria arxii CBS 175.79]